MTIQEEFKVSRLPLRIKEVLSPYFVFRAFMGLWGTALCALGATIALLPVSGFEGQVDLVKFAGGLMVFLAGFFVARTGGRAHNSELHFDPHYGQFLLLPAGESIDAAQCVLSVEKADLDISGRHLSVEGKDRGPRIRIALQDYESAAQVSASYQNMKSAA
ncbi:MAG: hypothetical protein ACU0A2_13465 [Cognatishimia sp.]|uniref:hypothetical protein n=1 Tax=Cognatishimia sp. TaxID=2211648 RepID=UPI004059A1F7